MSKKITIEMRNISIEFPGVKALSNVNFKAVSGVIHAIVGANGAGKSTLMKVLGGVEDTYTGQIFINGEEVIIRRPQDAKKLGIEIVYQEVDMALALNLNIAENIMLSSMIRHSKGKPFVNWQYIYKTAKETLKKMKIDLDVRTPVLELPLAQRQMVLIARSIVEKCSILVLDEPTASLSRKETDELFRIMRELAEEQNIIVLYISHRLPELFEICEDITVLRDGQFVAKEKIANLEIKQIVEMMLGHKFDDVYPKHKVDIGDVILEVKNLTSEKWEVKDISFNVRAGEIIGICGLVGAGKTELCKSLFSEIKVIEGTVVLNGKMHKYKNPHEAVAAGIAFVPEERRKEGVLIEESVKTNLSAASLQDFCNNLQFINFNKERKKSLEAIKSLEIKTPNENSLVKFLSGGNQQKVAVGKWLIADADIYILDEPTKGIDVGAKNDIFELIGKLVALGKGIIYATCEFPEILGISDRIYVMHNGAIVKELKTKNATEKDLLLYSMGVTKND